MGLSRQHRHQLDPELSAYVAAPCCGCGAFLWGEAGAPAEKAAVQMDVFEPVVNVDANGPDRTESETSP